MNARRSWLPQMSQLLPDDPNPPGAGGGGAGNPPLPAPPIEPTLTQSAVNALVARETDRAQRSFRDGLLTQLGVASVEDLTAVVTAAKAANEAQMSEQQRATAAAEAARVAADQETKATLAERVTAKKERGLMRAGLPLMVKDATGKEVENPQLGYALRLLDLDSTADDAAVTAAVSKLKTDLPALFVAPSTGPAGDPGPPPRGPANGGTVGAAGKARAERYAAQRPGAPRPPA